MDKLFKVSKDGLNFYCFVEVKNVLFPNVPKSTVKSWLRELKITTVRLTETEHNNAKCVLPYLTGAFGFIREDNLEKLLEFWKYKQSYRLKQQNDTELINVTNENIDNQSSSASKLYVISDLGNNNVACSSETSNDNRVSPSAEAISVHDEAASESQSKVAAASKIYKEQSSSTVNELVRTSETITTDCIPARTTEPLTTDSITTSETVTTTDLPLKPVTKTTTETGINSELACNIDTVSDKQGTSGKTSAKTPRRRMQYSLQEQEMSVELMEEIARFVRFYSCDINPSRDCAKFSDSTINKVRERLSCFLGFVNTSYPSKILSLALTSDIGLVEGYVQYLMRVRKLMASTVLRNLSALITVIKYTHCDPQVEVEKLPQTVSIRNMQHQLTREESLTRKRKREGFISTQGEKLYFSHILDVLRQLRDQYHSTSGISSARYLHDFVMVSLYVRALPGRSKDLRTLQFIDNSESTKRFSTENIDGLNALVFDNEGSVILIETDFKNVKSMGPSKIDLTNDEWLTYFLKLYASKHRLKLMLGKSHNCFFFNTFGDPFLSSSSIAKYLGDLFEREVSVRASTTKMRHAICTYFLSLPQSANEKLKESLACLLKHSVKHQSLTYNDQRREEKVELGRSFMCNAITQSAIFEEEGEMSHIKSSPPKNADQNDDDSSSDDEILPEVGQLCALLDPISSTPDNACIFIAKVLRYTPDKNTVHLQELEAIPDSADLYRVKCSSVWKENVECLSYPIDIVYLSSEKAYQLRTTRQQIYEDIKHKV